MSGTGSKLAPPNLTRSGHGLCTVCTRSIHLTGLQSHTEAHSSQSVSVQYIIDHMRSRCGQCSLKNHALCALQQCTTDLNLYLMWSRSKDVSNPNANALTAAARVPCFLQSLRSKRLRFSQMHNSRAQQRVSWL